MFGWFKKEEEVILIRKNPEARDAALANRKIKAHRAIKLSYENLIERINCSIEQGALELTSTFDGWTGTSPIKKYSDNEKYVYLAARELRKNGFKVRVNKKHLIKANGNNYYFDQYYKSFTISW